MPASLFSSTDHQEQFGHAFIRAIAALAGCEFSEPKPDRNKIDVFINKQFASDPKYFTLDPFIKFQVKTATRVVSESTTTFGYQADQTLYDRLRETKLAIPFFLVVIRLPHHPTNPLNQDNTRTVLYNAPFYASIKGAAALAPGASSKVITFQKSDLLTPSSLEALLEQKARGLI